MNKKASAKELATLALAKSIVEGDAEAAMGALKAKADYDAFWIDGATRLRDLAKSRGARSVSLVIEEAARSRGLKALPPMAESPDRWSRALVESHRVEVGPHQECEMRRCQAGWREPLET
jgi:hypothetical protein